MTVTEQSAKLQQILAQGDLTTLFQPIVSLSERRVLGYEALSRGPSNSSLHSPLTLFAAARQANRLTELEMLCRKSACQRFSRQNLQGKLFLNVSPDTLIAPGHKPGCTLALLEQAGIPPSEVVIELTEQTPTDDFVLLDNALRHYREMGFSIALDDLGAGYSSLRLWSELRPDFVKIDRYFIENIHQDRVKREFVESILNIAGASQARVIAEGIELQEELQVLIDMGVDLVQGYLLGRPQETPRPDLLDLVPLPELARLPASEEGCDLSALVLPEPAVPDTRLVAEVLQELRDNPGRMSVAVVDAERRPVGIIHRHQLSEALLKPFAADLLARKPVSRLMSRDLVTVEVSQSLQRISRQLTSRPRHLLEEAFIITEGGRYLGLGRVLDVLRLITDLKVRQARHANPLTLLPGNVPIQQHLAGLLRTERAAAICYVDIDHFKPFNDIYGYAKGDEVLLLLAGCLKRMARPGREFVGHIGGDDFLLILEGGDWHSRLQRLFDEFRRASHPLYTEEHRGQGFFIAKGRHGLPEYHPLLSLSVGVVLLDGARQVRLDAAHLASLASQAKAQAKRLSGDSLYPLDGNQADALYSPSLAAQAS